MTRKNSLCIARKIALTTVASLVPFMGTAGQFEDVEVRVIRNKYFQKTMRVELGSSLNMVMNKSFVYTALVGGSLNFHITEQFGVFGEGGMGMTWNKSDCSTLGEQYRIEPLVDELENWFAGGLVYTPIYGKYQLSSGDVLYFDWFFFGSAGIASLTERKGTCIPDAEVSSRPFAPAFHFSVATGQRYFLSKNTAFVWNVRLMRLNETMPADEANQVPATSDTVSNVLFSVGLSYFLF